MKEFFIDHRFTAASLTLIDKIEELLEEYEAQGFTLNLRQLYYQLVTMNIIENSQRSYKRLGALVSNARLAGLIDWDAIEDRTRFLRGNNHWNSPQSIIRSSLYSYRRDKWENQPYRVEVWIEKDALVGVIERICRRLDVDYFACRGYVSQSEQYRAGKRHLGYWEGGQMTLMVHLGDHDPSGIDMTRDNQDRLSMFAGAHVDVRRIALNMDQVEEHDLPPNPAKFSDSRVGGYIDNYGYESWELDALKPATIADLIEKEIDTVRDMEKWNETVAREQEEKDNLQKLVDRWDDVVKFLDE